jgi:multiple sugar transport system permease protein
MLRPTMFLVLTLGLIGSWQVFDQIFVMSKGGPDKTTLSPAYVSYTTGFADQNFPAAAAMAFVLFAIIVLMTLAQRRLLRERRSS